MGSVGKPQTAEDLAETTEVRSFVPAHGGGRLRYGNPGNSGRPSSALRQRLRDILTDPAVMKAVRDILIDPENRSFPALWKAVADRGFGPVVHKVKHSGAVSGVVLLPEASWGAPQPQALPQEGLRQLAAAVSDAIEVASVAPVVSENAAIYPDSGASEAPQPQALPQEDAS